MFLSRASVRRPIAMSCFIIMLVLFGINSWDQLGLDAFPNVEIPYVTVTTVYPGASPRSRSMSPSASRTRSAPSTDSRP